MDHVEYFDHELESLYGSEHDWLCSNIQIDSIIDTAMNRHNVKKSKRPHIEAVVFEAVGLLVRDMDKYYNPNN